LSTTDECTSTLEDIWSTSEHSQSVGKEQRSAQQEVAAVAAQSPHFAVGEPQSVERSLRTTQCKYSDQCHEESEYLQTYTRVVTSGPRQAAGEQGCSSDTSQDFDADQCCEEKDESLTPLASGFVSARIRQHQELISQRSQSFSTQSKPKFSHHGAKTQSFAVQSELKFSGLQAKAQSFAVQ
jgi:hypothetical protein